jgi:predicted negative regulator of RcsB-dependent stress response
MAIDEMLNEHEQSEKVRSWLRSNAMGLVGGVALGLAVIVGWQQWQTHQLQSKMGANERYAGFVESLEMGKVPQDNGQAELAGLKENNLTLATLAALQLAKAQLDANKPADAISTLQQFSEVKTDLQPVVRERLARLLIDAGKAKEALVLLNDSKNAASLNALGDAQFILGDHEKARDAYRKALALVDVADPQHHLITLKLVEAGGVPASTEGQG